MMHTRPHRGFALLIAIVLTSVILSLALALLDIAYKQLILSSTAKQSEIAFYNADSAMECALYFDQQTTGSAFDYTITTAPSITCQGITAKNVTTSTSGSGASAKRTTSYDLPCPAAGTLQARVTVYKWQSAVTSIYANGFNSCDQSDPRRIERGIKVTY